MSEQYQADFTGTERAQSYQILIRGHLNPQRWVDWFTGLTITTLENGDTLLSGPLADQSALHGVLTRIRDLNLTLLSVTKADAE